MLAKGCSSSVYAGPMDGGCLALPWGNRRLTEAASPSTVWDETAAEKLEKAEVRIVTGVKAMPSESDHRAPSS